MASSLELSSRALLCRRLAEQEPANRVFWIAEAENWSRLSESEASQRKNLFKCLGVFSSPVRKKPTMPGVAVDARKTA
jgi:hypothetical protein